MNLNKLLKESLDEKIKKQHRYKGDLSVHVIYGKKDNKLAVHLFTKNKNTVSDEKLMFVKDENEYDDVRKKVFTNFKNKQK